MPEHVGSHDHAGGLSVEALDDRPTGHLRVVGELDAASADTLLEAGRSAIAEGAAEVVVECSGVRFCDSAGLRALMLLNRETTLVLERPAEAITRLLRLLGIDGLKVV